MVRFQAVSAGSVNPLGAPPQDSDSRSRRKLCPAPLQPPPPVAHIKQMTQTPQTTSNPTKEINLSGEWIGFYRGHYDQVIKITQLGEEVVAVKITGDEHVPGGAVTFRANVKTGVGEGQVAEKEYRNPCFVPGKLEVINAERIVFTWENCGKVEF